MKYFFVLLSLIAISSIVFGASCLDPDRTIDLNTDRTYENGIFKATITTVTGSGPFLGCSCQIGKDCYWYWQYKNIDNNPHWQDIPTSGTLTDFNCSGVACRNKNPLFTTGGTKSMDITCVDQGEFELQGYNNFLDKNTNPVRINCYPFGNETKPVDCVPPENGNFDQNTYCNYVNVDLWIGSDGNYNILGNGHSVHNNSDVNYQTSKGILQVFDGGVIDLNDTEFFLGGFSFNKSSSWAIPLLLFLTIFPLLFFPRSLLYRSETIE